MTTTDTQRVDRICDAINFLIHTEWHPEWPIPTTIMGGPFSQAFNTAFQGDPTISRDDDPAARLGAAKLAAAMWQKVNSGDEDYNEYQLWSTQSMAGLLTAEITLLLRLGRANRPVVA